MRLYFLLVSEKNSTPVLHLKDVYEQNKTNSVAISPRANYTDWATATCRRYTLPTFVDSGMSSSKLGGSPTVVNLSFLDQSHYFSFK
jgi:inosine/xanthosine triphosphate pyrophosphatase family protein